MVGIEGWIEIIWSWFNVRQSTLIQRWSPDVESTSGNRRWFNVVISTSIQLSNPTIFQRCFNVEVWRWFNVDSTLKCPLGFKEKLDFDWFYKKINDGWMNCHFKSFSTVFQSYQDDGRMIMKGCVQWNRLRLKRSSPQAGLELTTAELPGLLGKLTLQLSKVLCLNQYVHHQISQAVILFWLWQLSWGSRHVFSYCKYK